MIKLSSEKWNLISEAIYTINAETHLDKLRGDVLAALDTLIPFERAFFDLGMRQGSKVDFFDPLPRKMEQRYLDLLFDEYLHIDPMFWFFSQNRTEIYRESDFVDQAIQGNTAFHDGWLAPQGIYYSMGSMVVYGGILYGSVNLWRSKAHGDFSDEDVQVMSIINRHLSLRFGTWFPRGIRRRGAKDCSKPLVDRYHLTPRETEIAALIYEGSSIREIAEALFVTEDTVKKHTSNIFRKMKVNSRVRLVKAMRDHVD
jgi:DNA-binding CsgD family transcriptional regulator